MASKAFGDLAHGRDNNFNLLRMIAATSVLVSHSFPLTLGPDAEQPLQRWLHFTLGTVAVQTFFAISGFFIAKSFDRRSSLVDFWVARLLRLYPALLVALAFTAWFLGPIVTTLPSSAYFSARETWTYVPVNAVLRKLQELLPGVFPANPAPYAVNGSLWTLYSEVKCYVLIAGVGVVGLLRPIGFLAAVAAMIVYQIHGRLHDPFADQALFVALSLPFFVGTFCYVYRSVVPHSFWLALALMVCASAARGLPTLYAILFPVALGYSVLWLGLASAPFLRGYNRLGDYSYGIYVYAWPVQQALVATSGIGTPWMLTAAAAPLTLILAILSWSLVEAPCLGRRHRVGQAIARRLRLA